MFNRNYMDYHQARFEDHSLLFFKEEKLIALLPANRKNNLLESHGGLTFGGVLSGNKMSTISMLEIFDSLKNYCVEQEINKLLYKAIPSFYHVMPAQEDLYALFRNNAKLVRRDASSIIQFDNKAGYSKGTKWNLGKAKKNNLVIKQSDDFTTFMQMENEILQAKYGTSSTHSAEEIKLLALLFPENIKLFLIFHEQSCLGGTIIFESSQVAHTQYIAISEAGKEIGALDFLTDQLIQQYSKSKKYFSFGISTEKQGVHLNEGLMHNKESFGARTVVHDFYELAF